MIAVISLMGRQSVFALQTLNRIPHAQILVNGKLAQEADRFRIGLGQSVLLDGSSSQDPDADSLVRFHWKLSDGTIIETQKLSHIFQKPGTYSVVLMVDDGRGGNFEYERLERGLMAFVQGQGKIFLSWRLLDTDPEQLGFYVLRSEDENGPFMRIHKEMIDESTGYLDESVSSGRDYYYQVARINTQTRIEEEVSPVIKIRAGDKLKNYFELATAAKEIDRITVGDLDGDGELDYVSISPRGNVDPCKSCNNYWKKSVGTFKIEAYRNNGQFLWRFDWGWGIEMGVWYSPLVVWDLENDGRAEVIIKMVRSQNPDSLKGNEFLTILDGLTGKIKKQAVWPNAEIVGDYNYFSRNLLAIAYLDGIHPSIIVDRGTYGNALIQAFDSQLNLLWEWQPHGPYANYSGSGAHGLPIIDIDEDGKDEILWGSTCIDDNGIPLWGALVPNMNYPVGHVDVCVPGDIDPANPGLEIFYAVEQNYALGNCQTRQPCREEGIFLVDHMGQQLPGDWQWNTTHAHSGFAADLTEKYPGVECYSYNIHEEKDPAETEYFLFSSKGEIIGRERLPETPIEWDGDPQYELIMSEGIGNYGENPTVLIEGHVLGIADLFGDYREEVICDVQGKLRIYSNTASLNKKKITRLRERSYRLSLARFAMGYYRIPIVGESWWSGRSAE